MSTIASHSPLNISESVRDRDLVPTSKGPYKWPMGNQMITWPDVMWPQKVKPVPQYA